MTLEDKIAAIWGFSSNEIASWTALSGEWDYSIYLNPRGSREALVCEAALLIKEDLANALLSSSLYVRKFAELLKHDT